MPDFASKTDSHGCSPLHLACSKGHLETTKELLRSDSDLTSLQDHESRTPFYWAAIKGRVNNVDEILSMSLESAEILPPSTAAATVGGRLERDRGGERRRSSSMGTSSVEFCFPSAEQLDTKQVRLVFDWVGRMRDLEMEEEVGEDETEID
ncbi:Transient receptor potential cation channel subfamily A member 1 [Camellia lanceoleosa]|uniref:Transient receptor potential cation channel subfamily A member 1 n=1 Tax=Camellia lanceoleosa TaxID=1840588 RepID=A0ACC0HKH2_9ERIC|nr:Transient receptor potential cation channel subfamily A member 1 [Camellia lanceoleosa]